MNNKILITGCGRSGTVYMSKLLLALGLDVQHEEEIGKDGVVSWLMATKSDKILNSNYPKFSDYNFNIILHQVREPLKTISSCQVLQKYIWDFTKSFIPINDEDTLILKCMKYYYYWNLIAEKNAIWTFKIENLKEELELFCKKIQHTELYNKKSLEIIENFPIDVNTRRGSFKPLTWEELEKEDSSLYKLIKEQAKRYNYKTN